MIPLLLRQEEQQKVYCGQEAELLSREIQNSMFVSGIENLPCELQRNFQLMRELDQRTEGGFSRAECCLQPAVPKARKRRQCGVGGEPGSWATSAFERALALLKSVVVCWIFTHLHVTSCVCVCACVCTCRRTCVCTCGTMLVC